MKSGRRIKRQLLVVLLLLGVVPPAVALAGHGVEDTVDTLPVEKVKQLIDAGENSTRFPSPGVWCFIATANHTTLRIAPCFWNIAAIEISS